MTTIMDTKDKVKTERIIDEFKNFLNSQGREYTNNFYITSYRKDLQDEWHVRFDIRSNGKYIQSFVIMDEDERLKKCPGKYPFYRSFTQQTQNGNKVLPSCFIAVYDKDYNWRMYNCNCLDDEIKSENITNYVKCAANFKEKWDKASGKRELLILKIICWIFALCCCVALLFSNSIGLSADNDVIIFVLGIILTIFPLFASGIKSFTIGLNGVSFEKEETER